MAERGKAGSVARPIRWAPGAALVGVVQARLRRWPARACADDTRTPLAIFLLSRFFIFLLGAIAMHIALFIPPVPALGFFLPELSGPAHYLLQPWRNWDGHWYALIAQEGYRYDRQTTAFYPLYPLILRLGGALLGGRVVLAGVLISNLAFLGALLLLYRLLQLDFPRPIARRAILYLALFPTAFYFSAVYSESLFLLLAVACLYAARRDHWWLAGLLGFLAATTRVQGLLLLLPLGLFYLQQHGHDPRRWWREPRTNPLSLLLVPAGLLVWLAFLNQLYGDPLVTLKAQQGWDRSSANPIRTLRLGWEQIDGCDVRDWAGAGVDFCWAERLKAAPTPSTVRDHRWRYGFSESDFVEFWATAFLLLLSAVALTLSWLRRLPLAYSTYLAAGVVLPLWSPSIVHPLMSMHRFALILFPAFIVLALIGRWRPLHAAWLIVSATLLAFFAIQFASWYWVA